MFAFKGGKKKGHWFPFVSGLLGNSTFFWRSKSRDFHIDFVWKHSRLPPRKRGPHVFLISKKSPITLSGWHRLNSFFIHNSRHLFSLAMFGGVEVTFSLFLVSSFFNMFFPLLEACTKRNGWMAFWSPRCHCWEAYVYIHTRCIYVWCMHMYVLDSIERSLCWGLWLAHAMCWHELVSNEKSRINRDASRLRYSTELVLGS